MKGFLHRIAASALGENARVHPMVRPLFAQGDAVTEPLSAMETGVVRERAGAEAAEIPHVREATPRMSGSREEGEARNRAEEREIRPLVPQELVQGPRRTSEREGGGERDDLRGAAGREGVHGAPASRVERIERTEVRVVREEAAGGSADVDEYKPLVKIPLKRESEVYRSQPFVLPPHPVLEPGASPRGVMKNAREANPATVREKSPVQDQIEIHIGRIEVTAVTEVPPVRVAARPQRRGQTLDEYLRGGGERRMG